jgi:hypothetical protein
MSTKEEKEKVATLEIAKIVVPLLSLPVGTLILALVPQVRDDIWPATPKGLLLALLVVILSVILGLVPYALRLRRKYQTLVAHLTTDLDKATGENRSLKTQIDTLLAKDDDINLDLHQALSHLQAFKENVPKNGSIREELVTEYHNILTRIEKESNHNLGAFRISSNEVNYHETKYPASRRIGSHYSPAHVQRSDHRYCNREVFLTRLHGVVKSLTGNVL